MNTRLGLALLLTLAPWSLLAAPPTPLSAEDPSSRPPLSSVPAPSAPVPTETRFDGGHIGPFAAVGFGWPDRLDAPAGQLGWGIRAGLRYATLLQLLDLETWCEYGGHPASGAGSIRRTTLGIQVNLHPLFWLLVWDNLAGWLGAGVHGYLSTGAAHMSVQGVDLVAATGGQGATVARWAMHNEVGLGFDVPLSSRKATSGLWLSLRGGWRWLHISQAPGQRLDLGDLHLQIAIGWRRYASLSASPASAGRVRFGGPSASAGLAMRRSKSSQMRASSRQ